MTKKGILIGTVAYLLLTFVIFPLVFTIPQSLFLSDDAAYSGAGIGLLEHGFLSLDGVHAFMDREPGQSVLLAFTYEIFGIESHVGVFLVQGLLFFLASFVFCRMLARITSPRIADIAFFILLTSGSTLHTVFTAYRECLALSLLLLFAALYISYTEKKACRKVVGLGVLLAATILTYYSFIYFPVALALLWIVERKPVKCIVLLLVTTYALTNLWAYRNQVYLGHFSIIDSRRANIAWYVRGEQAVNVQGLEPLRCLWAEYVSRDWSHVSPSCSFNGIMNRHWPNSFEAGVDYSADGQEGINKIKAHPISYLWFSAVDIIELHLPYVGGGWGTMYNAYALLTQVLLFLGFAFGLSSLLNPKLRLFWLLIAYNTLLFILTDATPRYLLPVFFCYAVIAAIGYDRSLKRLSHS